jgi:hypothetical protein
MGMQADTALAVTVPFLCSLVYMQLYIQNATGYCKLTSCLFGWWLMTGADLF